MPVRGFVSCCVRRSRSSFWHRFDSHFSPDHPAYDIEARPEMLNAFAIASGRSREGRKCRVIGIEGALEAPVLLSGQSLVDTIRYLGHRVAK